MTVVDDFAADYFVVEGITRKRQHDVLRTLGLLEAFAGAPPETLDELAVEAFVTAQVRSGLNINTVRFQLKAIKPFYNWCWRKRIVDADRVMRIREVKPPRGSADNHRPRPYTRKEIQRFWQEIDARFPLATDLSLRRWERGTSRYRQIWRHPMNLQIHAIAGLALFGGLRHTEIRLIGIDDLHPDNDFIIVRGKSPFGQNQGYREVPYTEQGREFVGRWLEFRAKLAPTHERPWLVLTASASPNSAVAPSHPTNRISEGAFKKLLLKVGPGWEFHRLRHTCGTEWLRAGNMKLEKVSKLLGHANITQTLGYAQVVREDVARDVRRGERDFTTAVGRQAA